MIVIVPTGISDLCELLKVNNSLQEVEMGYIDDDGMSLINNSLQEVEMGYIDDDGMSLFFYGLLCNNAELRMLNCGLFVESMYVVCISAKTSQMYKMLGRKSLNEKVVNCQAYRRNIKI